MKKFMYDIMNEETGEIIERDLKTEDLSDEWTAEHVKFFYSFGYDRAVNVREIK